MAELICKGCGAHVAEDGTTTYDGPPKEGEHVHDPQPAQTPATQTSTPAVPPVPLKLTMFEYLED